MGIVHVDKPVKCDVCGNKYSSMGAWPYPQYGYMNAGTVFQYKEPTEADRKKKALIVAIFENEKELELILGEWYISVGYGSVLFDGELFLFKDKLQPVFDNLVICDSCIAELVSNGSILKIWDFFDHDTP